MTFIQDNTPSCMSKLAQEYLLREWIHTWLNPSHFSALVSRGFSLFLCVMKKLTGGTFKLLSGVKIAVFQCLYHTSKVRSKRVFRQ